VAIRLITTIIILRALSMEAARTDPHDEEVAFLFSSDSINLYATALWSRDRGTRSDDTGRPGFDTGIAIINWTT
jgi:hypothetical protein